MEHGIKVFRDFREIIDQNQQLAEADPGLTQYYLAKTVAECRWVNQLHTLGTLGERVGMLPAFMTSGKNAGQTGNQTRQQTQGNNSTR